MVNNGSSTVGVSINMGTPIAGWFISRKILLLKWTICMIWGYPYLKPLYMVMGLVI